MEVRMNTLTPELFLALYQSLVGNRRVSSR